MMAPPRTLTVEKNREVTGKSVADRKRMILVCCLSGYSEAASASLVRKGGARELHFDEDLYERLKTRFSRERSNWADGMDVMVIAQTHAPVKTFRRRDGKPFRLPIDVRA